MGYAESVQVSNLSNESTGAGDLIRRFDCASSCIMRRWSIDGTVK